MCELHCIGIADDTLKGLLAGQELGVEGRKLRLNFPVCASQIS